MASWPTWFPAPHEASSDFLGLTASFLDRENDRSNGWRDVRLFDETEMPYREGSPDAGEVIATNARLLAGTPHWLRPGTVPAPTSTCSATSTLPGSPLWSTRPCPTA